MTDLPLRPRVRHIHPLVGKSERWLRQRLADDPTLAERLGRTRNGTFDRAKVLRWVDEQLMTPDPRTANLGNRTARGPRRLPSERIGSVKLGATLGRSARWVVSRLCDSPDTRRSSEARKTGGAWTFNREKALAWFRNQST